MESPLSVLLKGPVGRTKEALNAAGFCMGKRNGVGSGPNNAEHCYSPLKKPPTSSAVENARIKRENGGTAAEHRHASLGIVRLDYDYSPAPGGIDHPGSFGYGVVYRVIPGLTFAMCQSGEMTPEIEERFMNAVKWLDAKGVSCITGDCGFFMKFQNIARRATHKPVIMSSLCALPSIVCAYAKHERIAIFTANKASLQAMHKLLWDEYGVDPEDQRFVIVGCQDVPGFEAVALGERVDVEKCRPHIVKLAEDTMAEHAETSTPIRAIIFECTELPPYSDAVRAATKLPVYDVITTCNSFVASNPRLSAAEKEREW